MDWMEFVSSLVASLAWPSAAIAILFLFKEEVAKHLPLLQKLKLPGGIEAEFSKELATVAAAIESSDAVQTPAEVPVAEAAPLGAIEAEVSTTPNLLSFMVADDDPAALRANPTGVVMEAWKGLEAVLRLATNRAKKNVVVASQAGFSTVLMFLANANFLTSEEIDNLRKLKKMRDLAAHSQDKISVDSANEFAEIAGRMSRNLTVRMGQMYPVVQ